MYPQFWTIKLCDRRIFHELESSSCLCISSNNADFFCPEQDTSVSVQNSSYNPPPPTPHPPSRPRWLIWMRRPTVRLGGRGFNRHRGQQHSFVEIDHEIFSTVILSLPLIQEGQLSVSVERMRTILVNRLED